MLVAQHTVARLLGLEMLIADVLHQLIDNPLGNKRLAFVSRPIGIFQHFLLLFAGFIEKQFVRLLFIHLCYL